MSLSYPKLDDDVLAQENINKPSSLNNTDQGALTHHCMQYLGDLVRH